MGKLGLFWQNVYSWQQVCIRSQQSGPSACNDFVTSVLLCIPIFNSFQSYNIRRLELNVTTPQSSRTVKTKRSGKKGTADVALAAAATAPVDFTDTVALLTPFIKEVDTWPAATHNLTTLPNVVQKEKTSNIDATDYHTVSVGKRETPAVDRSVFLKEAKTNPALRYLENAMCDMRYENIIFLLWYLHLSILSFIFSMICLV